MLPDSTSQRLYHWIGGLHRRESYKFRAAWTQRFREIWIFWFGGFREFGIQGLKVYDQGAVLGILRCPNGQTWTVAALLPSWLLLRGCKPMRKVTCSQSLVLTVRQQTASATVLVSFGFTSTFHVGSHVRCLMVVKSLLVLLKPLLCCLFFSLLRPLLFCCYHKQPLVEQQQQQLLLLLLLLLLPLPRPFNCLGHCYCCFCCCYYQCCCYYFDHVLPVPRPPLLQSLYYPCYSDYH